MISRRTLAALGIAGAVGWIFSRTGSSPATAEAKPKGPFEVTKSNEEWRRILTPKQYYVLRDHGTERPFTSPLDKIYEPGTYHCAGCDLPLFSSEHKYDSRTGWPSFWQPINETAIGESVDYLIGFPRTEVHCARCGGHQGHVFKDGPPPTGLRYCINGVALTFKPKSEVQQG